MVDGGAGFSERFAGLDWVAIFAGMASVVLFSALAGVVEGVAPDLRPTLSSPYMPIAYLSGGCLVGGWLARRAKSLHAFLVLVGWGVALAVIYLVTHY